VKAPGHKVTHSLQHCCRVAMTMRCTFALLIMAPHIGDACTTFAAGRKATADGSVLVSHSNDGDPIVDVRFAYVPAADHPPGAMRPIYNLNINEGGFPRYVGKDSGSDYFPNADTGGNLTAPIAYIPQVLQTFAYQDTFFAVTNEHNVAIGESTCSAMFKTCAKGTAVGCEEGRSVGEALMSIDTLTKIAMERTRTAREAVLLMGALAVQHGFFGTQDDNGSGEALQVGDAEEAFTFNILADPTGTSAIWAARRVPDENVTVLSNMFTIREVNATDTFNYLASPNLYSIAQERGWWKPGQAFDFTRIYSNGEYGAKYYAGRRMWSGLRQIAPSAHLPADYGDLRYDRVWPWSIKPDVLLTPQHVMKFHRDWYAGTPFDMTKGTAAGPFGTPDRWATESKSVVGRWERSIAIYRSNWVHVQQLRSPSATLPKEFAGVTWFGAGAAHYTPFVPVPSGLTRSLTPLMTGVPHRFDRGSMNWASRKIGDICQIRFDRMHPLVELRQNELEDQGAQLVASAAAQFAISGDRNAMNEKFEGFSERVLQAWHDLGNELVFSMSDNTDILRHDPGNGHDGSLGYPDSWLRSTNYQSGPPLPPAENQCPPKCPQAASILV